MLVKINFLPYREQLLKNQAGAFKQTLLFTALAAAVAVMLWGYSYDQRLQNQQERNDFLSSEIQKLDNQLIEVKTLNTEIAALEQQRDTVYALQKNRTYALEWLDMLVRRTPEEMYLNKISHDGNVYSIQGVATNNERVSQFMTQLDQVQWIKNSRLIETQAKIIEEVAPITGIKTSRTLYDFSITFDRVEPSDVPVVDAAVANAPLPLPSDAAPPLAAPNSSTSSSVMSGAASVPSSASLAASSTQTPTIVPIQQP